MNVKTILTLLTKEYAILFRNRIFLMFGVAFLAVLIGIFYIMPAEINAEEPTVAVYSEAAGVQNKNANPDTSCIED